MDVTHARAVMESLRRGTPPDGSVRSFTVGRAEELQFLEDMLDKGSPRAILLQANFGSGKSHLLRVLRESALAKGFAVSSVTLDSRSKVRFNQMEQMFGAICRGLEVPTSQARRGVHEFLAHVCFAMEEARRSGHDTFWGKLTNDWRWDYSETLESPAMFVALRAWHADRPGKRDVVAAWLTEPWVYRSQRSKLYFDLVAPLRPQIRDPRPEWKFYADEVWLFHTQGHAQSWAALRDLDRLAKQSHLKGLVVLFDEFEDIITNLKRIDYQQQAFWNLFAFCAEGHFSGLSAFAVTPEFAEKCKRVLLAKYLIDFPLHRFDAISTFEMSPLSEAHLLELANRILKTHGVAYGWQPASVVSSVKYRALVREAASIAIGDRTRQTIKRAVEALDRAYEDTV